MSEQDIGGTLSPTGDVSMVVIPGGGHPALAVTPDVSLTASSPSRFHASARFDDQDGVSCSIGAVALWTAPGAQGEATFNLEVPAEELAALEAAFVDLIERYRAQAMAEAMANGYEAYKVNHRGLPAPTPPPPSEGV